MLLNQHRKILVTGGAGFIGSNLIKSLNTKGVTGIYVVDNLNHQRKKDHLISLKYEEYFDKKDFLNNLSDLKDIDIVVHLGACTDTTIYDEEYFRENNVEYSKRLFDHCLKNNARHIYASSAATYGGGERGYDDSERNLQPLNPYGHSKHRFDEFVYDAAEKPIQWVGLKFFNVYGPNEDHKGKMSSMVCQGYRQIREEGKIKLFKSYRPHCLDGDQKRDFVYVRDCVKVIMFFIDNPHCSGIFNVGTGKARSYNDLVKTIFTASDLVPQIDYIDMPEHIKDKFQYFTEADISKLRRVGYDEPFTELEDGVTDYVKNYLHLKESVI